jgi:hypothetical protein
MVQGLVFKHEHGRAKTVAKNSKEHQQAPAKAAHPACLYYRPNPKQTQVFSQKNSRPA